MARAWMAALLGALAVIASSMPLAARAADDAWVDALPTVSQVAAIAREMALERMRSRQRGKTARIDEDLLAADIVGGLRLMRWVTELKRAAGDGASQPARVARLRELTASYLQAERLIGATHGKRLGFLTTVRRCNVQKHDPRYAGTGGAECFRFWFGVLLSGTTSAGSFRADFFAKLYRCDEARGREFGALVQQHIRANAGRLKVPDTPAESLLPPALAAGRTPVCDGAGGDANGNGLCAAWERTPTRDDLKAAGGPIWCPCPEPQVSRPVDTWPRGTNFDATVVATGARNPRQNADECADGGLCWSQVPVEFDILKNGRSRGKYWGLEYVPGTLHRRSDYALQCHEVDPRFNCHGLTLAKGRYWLHEAATEQILGDWCKVFYRKTDARAGDLRMYRTTAWNLTWYAPSHSQILQADLREVDQKLGPVKYGYMPAWLDLKTEAWFNDPQRYHRCDF